MKTNASPRTNGRDEKGSSMIVVLMIGMVVTAAITMVTRTSTADLSSSARSQRVSTSFQAAEAGIDDFVAKLTEDKAYYLHRVHPAESTRRPSSGADVAAGGAWNGSSTWTYPHGRNAWRPLSNGYEYNVQVTAPSVANQGVKIVATARRTGTTNEMRSIETLVRPASAADFQMISNRDIAYGPTATTRGKIYAGIDSSGTAHSIYHDGQAYADLYAEGSIDPPSTYHNGAQGYDGSTIRTMVKNPINFNSFTGSLSDVQAAAASAGRTLNDPSVHAWWLVFNSNGTVTPYKCVRVGSTHIAGNGSCGSAQAAFAIPANGAVYAAQSVIVSGTVDGRVTVATNDDVVVGGNLAYEVSGDDVVGLIARDEVIVAGYAPSNLSWVGATIAQSGSWRSYYSSTTHGTMTFTGSTATNLGGYMTQFGDRNYVYDTALLYLQPPFFPVLEEAYSVLMFRELKP